MHSARHAVAYEDERLGEERRLGRGVLICHPPNRETHSPLFIHLANFMMFQRANKSSPLGNNCGIKCGVTGRAMNKTYYKTISCMNMLAERMGFEPMVPLPVHVLSKHAESATLAPLRTIF